MALIFLVAILVAAIVAAVFGFEAIAVGAAVLVKILSFVFIILLAVSLIKQLMEAGPPDE